MGSNTDYILVFESHNQAIFLYNYLLKKKYKVELVSTPCDLSVGCSQALKFRGEHMSSIISEARNNSIRINGIYKISGSAKNTVYEKVK